MQYRVGPVGFMYLPDDYQTFKDRVENWNSFSGGTELTFADLKHAISKVNRNTFVCVWTDDIGDDTNNAVLEAEIIKLKEKTNIEIFFMVVTTKNYNYFSKSPPSPPWSRWPSPITHGACNFFLYVQSSCVPPGFQRSCFISTQVTSRICLSLLFRYVSSADD